MNSSKHQLFTSNALVFLLAAIFFWRPKNHPRPFPPPQVTWGDPKGGGDSSHVKGQLTNVLKIQSTGKAFAALKSDGTVAPWLLFFFFLKVKKIRRHHV